MSKFTVRIELHNAEMSDYTKLYATLEHEGFSDIISSNTAKYKMPDGEYNIQGTYSVADILAKAKKAIASTTVKGSILVTKVEKRTWDNLKEI
jgi:hypothetical protein